ncbi:MAG: DUF2769 domain-containing protein [Candidatus Altiarchaeota archaeon]|nr:DUF2769 domain-containing protein [Candidatus Altiarchaeota archaeon]
MDKSGDKEGKTLAEKKRLCICSKCPSYNECAKEGMEGLFCATGKSTSCINEEKGCLCGGCPVYSMTGLSSGYYCTRGSEKEQRKE